MSRTPQTPAGTLPSLPPSKRRWFLAITVASPILFFVVIESILRLIHYGPDLSLFATETIGGTTYHIMNPAVKGRYFSKVQFSPNTSPDYFAVPKPAGTFRIFCLGGSTTVGFPYGYVGSFSTFLRDRLKHLFPERSIEVVNLGLTATNSYTVVDIVQELAEYEPDMLCVYDGHNEFHGALGIASHESVGASRQLIRLYLTLVRYRTFLLLRDIYFSVGGIASSAAEPTGGTMMERLAYGQYVRYGDERYAAALIHFNANLEDLKSYCTDRNIHLLLASQVSNLRDQPPFVSRDLEGLQAKQKLRFNALFNRGLSFMLDDLPDSALRQFDAALVLDSTRADLRYQRGRCLDSLRRRNEARTEYEKARDYDLLRFRASSDFNEALRSMDDGRRVLFVDVEKAFRSNSPDSLIGNGLILEHLHPNAWGNFLIAKEFTRTMHANSILADNTAWSDRDTLDDETLWANRPITELDSLCALGRTKLVTSEWPFTSDAQAPPPVPASDTLGMIAEAMVRGEMTWEQGHAAAAHLFEGRGDWHGVEKEYGALINQIPLNVSGYLLLGRAYIRQGRNQEAARVLLASRRVEETYYANHHLGILAQHTADAIPLFERAFALASTATEKTEAGYMLAEACHKNGKDKQAATILKHVLETSPDFEPAKRLLRSLGVADQ